MEKKRNQHYVWRHYLKPWATENQVWVNDSGKIHRVGLKGVGRKEYFYRLKEMSIADVEWITRAIKQSNGLSLQKVNVGFIRMFRTVYDLRASLKAHKISDAEFENELDKLESNLEENFHSAIESRSIKYLDSLLSGDTSFFNNNSNDGIAFLHYLTLQFMRTRNMQKRIVNSFISVGNENIVSMWPVLRHVFSLNIASSIWREKEKYKLILLKNNSDIRFITSDQPVINIYSTDGNGADGIEFYYPISPYLAVLMTEKDECKTVESILVDGSQARWLNQAIANFSDEQIYAFSKDDFNK